MGLIQNTIINFLKYAGNKILDIFRDIFREDTSIIGPSGAGKSTLLRILQGKKYYIGEYNSTQSIVTLNNKNVHYTLADKAIGKVDLKIKHDVPGENFDLWRHVLINDRPKGIILVVDLVGLVQNEKLDLESDEEFVNLDCSDENGERLIIKTTAKEKFSTHLESFKVIFETCKENRINIKGMIVFLNKLDLWKSKETNELDIRYQYKEEINKDINLTKMAKDLQMDGDIMFESTSMAPEYVKEWLEPALLRYGSRFK